ncbi:flavodoxin family protein [Gottschalkia acidurici 9a]|uniref:Flavodoxin family protein n=1 Tax=Gottschalkia acidurici (strain ATCC 7906 / DSM 604 / BCRC 14475 / CIP 104303 / KCTC 5404 / NCIMB 10678 / 9a) TaxID=1128398 RepID=K0AUF2_GOTA9|nr:flavodoxin family protein [Gottschalkia acidurici]AFS77478.1 flavodoxin family protein [Gottschalkia acidurici 9a]
MKILVTYSSKTGNTKKIAEGILEILPKDSIILPIEENIEPDEFDIILIGFWVDKGIADAKAMKYIDKIKGKKVGIFGTLGAYPDSEHGRQSIIRTKELLEPQNEVIAEFLCQGKVDPKLIEMFEKLPKDHPHGMTEERRKRHEDASSHPDEDDIKKAQEVFKKILVDN